MLDLGSADTVLKDDYKGRPVRQLPGGHMAAAKKMGKLGSGERFAALKSELARKGADNPGALAAFIGRKKYGAAKFSKMGAAGRARHAGR